MRVICFFFGVRPANVLLVYCCVRLHNDFMISHVVIAFNTLEKIFFTLFIHVKILSTQISTSFSAIFAALLYFQQSKSKVRISYQ